MKSSVWTILLLIALPPVQCHAAFITQSFLSNVRFVGDRAQQYREKEPLSFAAEANDQIFMLELGQYSSADVGQTFTFMRQPETSHKWSAIAYALHTGINAAGTGIPTMWLGFEENDSPTLSFFHLTAGFPSFNLQRIDITPRYYREGTSSATFRTAAFDVRLYWSIPEPATWLLVALGAATVLAIRRRV
jgi:hypothetical protein